MIEVASRVVHALHTKWGQRILHIVADEGISSTGAIDWEAIGPYKLVWLENLLVAITHRPSKAEADVRDKGITREWVFRDNVNDYAASLQRGDMPKYHCWKAFQKTNIGPCRGLGVRGQQKRLDDMVEMHYDNWARERRAAKLREKPPNPNPEMAPAAPAPPAPPGGENDVLDEQQRPVAARA